MTVITVKASVEIPTVPNFVKMSDGQRLPVSAITDEGLQQIGEEWTKALIANAKRQRETASDDGGRA